MLTRRSILGSTALPFLPKFKADEITVAETPYRVTRPMRIEVFNGHRFPFPWHLEPGDTVFAREVPGIHGVFVARDRANGPYLETLFAWNFHTKASSTRRVKSLPWTSDIYKFYSLENGHK